jgi:nucleoside-diphosphate-sugar epimerase
MASTKKTVLVVGGGYSRRSPTQDSILTYDLLVGTGAQGAAVAKTLAETEKYHVLVLTRNTSSPRAQALAACPNVELVHSPKEHGYDPAAFLEAAKRSDAVYVNTDGFALGEIAETFWGIRLYELSVRAGVKQLVYSGLDYNGKKTNYADELYVGHYEGKGRVQGENPQFRCATEKPRLIPAGRMDACPGQEWTNRMDDY